ANILEILRSRGASFATDLSTAAGRPPQDVERALWDGVARGLVMCDGFAAIRSKIRPGTVTPRPWRFSALRRASAITSGVAGRWSLVPRVEPDMDRHDLAEAVAEQLLNRWGVVFRDVALRDSLRLPWRELQWALR